MSIVGSVHIKCSLVVCGHVFPVDANDYLHELAEIAWKSNGSYQWPVRYCPRCEASAKHGGYESRRERDERIKKLESE